MSSLVSWLIDRVNGEKMTQEIIGIVLETAQNTIDDEMARVRRERIEQEEAAKAALEKRRLEEEKAEAEEQERLRKQHIELEKAGGSGGAVVVHSGTTRKVKRGKIVHRALDLSKSKVSAAANKNKKKKDAKKSADEGKDDKPNKEEKAESPFVDLNVQQINDVKNKIESASYLKLEERYLGDGVDPNTLKPLCQLFSLKLNVEDPVETLRLIFKKVKNRIREIIDLDNDTQEKMLAKVAAVGDEDDLEITAHLRENPFSEVLKDVRARLLVLLEVKPSVSFISNVTKVGAAGAGKVRSHYEQAKGGKMSRKGGADRGLK